MILIECKEVPDDSESITWDSCQVLADEYHVPIRDERNMAGPDGCAEPEAYSVHTIGITPEADKYLRIRQGAHQLMKRNYVMMEEAVNALESDRVELKGQVKTLTNRVQGLVSINDALRELKDNYHKMYKEDAASFRIARDECRYMHRTIFGLKMALLFCIGVSALTLAGLL